MHCHTDGTRSSKSESAEKMKPTTVAKKGIKKTKRPGGGVKKSRKRQLPVVKLESFDSNAYPEPNFTRSKPRCGDYGADLESLKRLSPLPFEAQQDAPSLTSFDYNTFCEFGLIEANLPQPSLTDEQDDAMNGFIPSDSAPSYPELLTGITFNGGNISHSPVTKREAT